jgi:hypothetical protein
MNEPVLAARSFPIGTDGYRVPLTFKVEGGLNYLHGNRAPYFSLTYTQHRKGFPEQCYSGGAGHDTILKYFPQFADLAALHLSYIDGEPMHAESNGWFFLAGALGGAGETYHAGNGKKQHWLPDGAFNGYRESTPDECLADFASHCRITIDEAADIRQRVAAAAAEAGGDWSAGRATWREIMERMRPRWKTEADAAIARHHLRVFGDEWEGSRL